MGFSIGKPKGVSFDGKIFSYCDGRKSTTISIEDFWEISHQTYEDEVLIKYRSEIGTKTLTADFGSEEKAENFVETVHRMRPDFGDETIERSRGAMVWRTIFYVVAVLVIGGLLTGVAYMAENHLVPEGRFLKAHVVMIIKIAQITGYLPFLLLTLGFAGFLLYGIGAMIKYPPIRRTLRSAAPPDQSLHIAKRLQKQVLPSIVGLLLLVVGIYGAIEQGIITPPGSSQTLVKSAPAAAPNLNYEKIAATDIRFNPAVLPKILAELKQQPPLAGKTLMIVGRMTAEYTLEAGTIIKIRLLLPDDPPQTLHYYYSYCNWEQQLQAELFDGQVREMSDRLIAMDAVDFSKVPAMYRAAVRKAKVDEGSPAIGEFSLEKKGQPAPRWSLAIHTSTGDSDIFFDLAGNIVENQQ